LETKGEPSQDKLEEGNQGKNGLIGPCGKVFNPTSKGGLRKPFWQKGGVWPEIGGVNSEEDEILD